VQITSKGQVTIPQEIRNRLGLLPHTEVEFEIVGDYVRIRKANAPRAAGRRGQRLVDLLRGTADTGLTTDEIMALTRGVDRPRSKRK